MPEPVIGQPHTAAPVMIALLSLNLALTAVIGTLRPAIEILLPAIGMFKV